MPRPRNPARIYKIPGRNSWYAYLSRDQRAISLQTADEAEAQRKLGEILATRGLQPRVIGEKGIGELFAESVIRKKTAGTSKTAYEAELDARRLLKWLHGVTVHHASNVTAQLVEDYKKHRAATVSAARINRELTAWKRAHRIAIERGYVRPESLEWFAKLREPKPQPHQRGLSRDEVDRFIAAETHPGYKALWRLVVGSAIRDEEFRHSDPSNVQPPWFVVTPKPPGACKCCPKGWTAKGYHYRSIPISEATAEAARTFYELRPTMGALGKRYVWGRMQRLCAEAGVAPFSLHDFRRAWASHMLAMGHSLQNISRWLGHRDVQTTLRYLRVTDDKAPDPRTLPF